MARPAGPAYGFRTLEMGTDGLDTWELQVKLIGWGSGTDNDGIGGLMDPVRVNGTFDATTRDAVKRFQMAHGLPPTGIVDPNTFRAIDDEVRNHPISIANLKCPCVSGKNDGGILCRCGDHPNPGKCSGFGKQRFAGQFLLDGAKDAALKAEKLPVYAMEEHDGVDKTALWAARALMHRAGIGRVQVTAGYRCWHDNYHDTDPTRWKHRRSVLHLGSSVEFIHVKKCVTKGANPCPECERIRQVALAKCGYQLRWHEPDRVTVGEGGLEAAPPAEPFALHLDTVMLLNREKADFVKTDADAAAPLYTRKVDFSLPVDLGGGRDPKYATTSVYYDNVEKAPGGQFPIGDGRVWHGGIHLTPTKFPSVRAMAEGEVVACRVGEAESAKALGSRNFVLLRHFWSGNNFYTLYMHLDGEAASPKAVAGWRRALYFRAKDHVEMTESGEVFRHKAAGGGSLTATSRLPARDCAETTGGEVDPRVLDPKAPLNSKVIKLDRVTDDYVYTKLNGIGVAKLNSAVAGLSDKLRNCDVIGLDKALPVHAGDVLGSVGKAPTHESLRGLGAFVHIEAFSDAVVLSGPGYVFLDASDEAKVADRKGITSALVAAGLLTNPPDGVLLDEDIVAHSDSVDRAKFRSAVVKMPSAWGIDWKVAFQKSKTFGFLKDAERDALGAEFLDYRWWPAAKTEAKGNMPPDGALYHYHPIVLLVQLAHTA
jgi:hypothetical protein